MAGEPWAEAILGGVLAADLAQPDDVAIGEPIPQRRDYLAERYGVNTYQDNVKTAEGADLVVMAIKPQDLPHVFGQLGGKLDKKQAVLSIVAGAKMSTLAEGLAHDSIIRVMPNTPAQIGCGMTLWTCSEPVSDGHRDMARSMLGTVGEEIYVADEKYLDMSTALSASGPAYVFMFVEALIDAGVYVGLPRDMARTLALQTVYGSVRLVMETGKTSRGTERHGGLPRRHHRRGTPGPGTGRRTRRRGGRGQRCLPEIRQAGPGIRSYFAMPEPVDLIHLLFNLIYLSILGRIILTLVLSFMTNDPPPFLVSITQVFVQVTEPILAPHPAGAAHLRDDRFQPPGCHIAAERGAADHSLCTGLGAGQTHSGSEKTRRSRAGVNLALGDRGSR